MNRRQFLEVVAASSMAAAASPGQIAGAAAREGERPFIDPARIGARNNGRSTVVCQHGVVGSSQPLASLVGVDVMKAGGNCIDAAIATNAMLGLTEPGSNGMGGDLFAILWVEKEQRLYGLNASGRSPYGWSLDKARELGLERIPSRSALAWSVPGCVSGWGTLNKRFGKFSLAQCLEPSIAYAEEGFPISPLIASQFLFRDEERPHMAGVYHPDGKVLGYGDIFRNPLLAKSYEAIAKDGPAAFYEGEIAEQIVGKAKELDGFMTMKDLADHEANWLDPVSSGYRGWDVWELPPNGQGIAALQILNILEQFDIASLEPNSAEHLHLFVEAKKLAFEDRAVYYADPDFADVPVEWLISKEYAKKRAALVNPKRANVEVPYGDPELDSDTIYLSAADGEGNMISLIQSQYANFGSRICPDGVGFTMQNRGSAFALDPNHRNKLEPHKRPFHTIIPAFLTKGGKPVMAFGVMGGDFQPQGHSQVIMNMIDFGMSPQQAGEQPRLAHDGSSSPWGGTMQDGGRLSFERGIDDGVKLALAAMGHNIQDGVDAHGGYQAVWREDDPLRYFAGTDPRKDGAAIGW